MGIQPSSRTMSALALVLMMFLLIPAFSAAATPPQINISATTLPTMGNVGQSFEISVPVSDDTGVKVVKIVYKPIGATTFEEINMTLSGGDTQSGTWTGTIPAQSSSGVVEFHIYALDNEGLSSTYPENDEQDLFVGSTGTVPEVVYFIPRNGAVVDPHNISVIKIGFNTAMDQPSVEGALSMNPNIPVEDFLWAANGTEVTLPLSSPLRSGTNYTITLSTSAKATDGTPMSAPYTVKFYAMEDFSGSGSDSGWSPVMVSIVSIGVLLLIALLMMRGLIKRNTREQDEEDED